MFLKLMHTSLGLKTRKCLVVEDTLNGVEAAKAPGTYVLGLTTSYTAGRLKKADRVVPTLKHAREEALNWQVI